MKNVRIRFISRQRSLVRTASLMLVALAGLLMADPSGAADRKPNFIIINIDDLGYADIEPFGSKVNRTPNLNRMAAEGRRLTSHYAAPVCSPSRASLMTGCYPKRVLSIPHVLFPGNDVGLDQRETTVAELLREKGYATGCIGKWHLGDQPEFLPRKHGFDYYYGLPYSNDMGPAGDGVKSNLGAPLPKPGTGRNGQPPLPLMRNETVLQRVLPADQQAIVERYTNEAVTFLWDHRDEPFFLYLPHSAVHFPLYPSERFRGKSKHGLFGDWVEEVDWSVGRVLDTVRDLGLAKNTMVIFTSDNGGQNQHGAINLPLRGGKGSTLEGGMRVCTVAWWPGKIPASTETAEITSHMDFLPTLTKLAGGKVPDDRRIDGGDIWPLLAGHADAKTPYESFLYYRGLNLQAVRSGPWKLHLQKGELYNLETDIGEATNVAKDNEEVITKLRAIAAAQKNDLGATDIGPGCRPLGRVENAQPLIDHDGKVRAGFEPRPVHAAQGIMLGELTSTSVLAQVRLTKTDHLVPNSYVARDGHKTGDVPGTAGVVRFILLPNSPAISSLSRRVLGTITVSDNRDFIGRIKATDLKPDTEYRLATQIGPDEDNLLPGPSATFRTHPGEDSQRPVSFVVVTGMNYAKFHGDERMDRALHLKNNNTVLPAPHSGPDKHLGYPALDSILRLKPNFFVGTGDNVYYDTPPGDEHRAQHVPELRQKWHEQFVQPRYRNLFAAVPTYWMIDDHDYRIDDGDNTGDHLPSPETGLRMMLEQLPYGPADRDKETKTYRTHRVSKDLQVWFTENRVYRSPNAMKDGPDKSIWGKEQKAWLMKTLAESDATFKLLVSPTPMIGPDDKRKFDNHTNFNGFRHERDEFFKWLGESGAGRNFYLVCGDRHWQYRSIHPSGVEEFSCGALVDPNSRLGRLPGDPASTDPDGLIKQPYAQSERSGGFLQIESARSEAGEPILTFQFRDEHGVVLHRHQKSATQNR
ncbi:MAG: sulfatase-like hydrolase/transferase [Planctomycetota bacterium]|nr:sulfatase-like hydrolase/transferase [Planctomycetota bacterium]MDA1250901.1 sulfatase-like hydrolase/transferase [Planctomycetota bacterium]